MSTPIASASLTPIARQTYEESERKWRETFHEVHGRDPLASDHPEHRSPWDYQQALDQLRSPIEW